MRRKCRLALLAASTSGLLVVPSLGYAQVEIQNFHNFNPDVYYGTWATPNSTIISNPTNWETASTAGYGSCYYGYYTDNGGATIDASSAAMLQLSFTINSGDAGLFADLDDGEGDFWQWKVGGFGMTAGTYVVDVPWSDTYARTPAARNVPANGFDLTQITGMNFELDPGATNGVPNPYDVTWTDLSAVNPNLTWNNANYANLQIANASADGVTWDSANNLNWNNGTNSSVYADGSFVTFNDNNSSNNAVTINSVVRPGSVTVNNTLANYTFSGTGSIAGTTSLAKMGSGTLNLNTANTFTGGTTISSGSVVLGNSKALGFGGIVTGNAGGTSVTTGGTLNLAGQSITQPITLNGGSLINSNTGAAAGVSSGILGDGIVNASASISGDASVTFTGSGTGAAATPELGISVATFTLTNGGSGYNDVGRGSTAANPTVTVTGGGGTGAILGAVTNTAGVVTGIDIYSAGSGFTSAPTITISAPSAGGTQATVSTTNLFTLLGIEQTAAGSGYYTAPTATVTASSGSATLGTPVISGVILAGTGNIGGPGNINLLGTVSGVGMLNKIGSGTVSLSAPNTYSGGTTVNAGVLAILPTTPLSATQSALPTGALTITGTGVARLATNVTQGSQSSPTPASNVNITSLSITGNGTLDINNNHIIIDYTPGNDPIASIETLVNEGANLNPSTGAATWTGTGITSSAAASNAASYGIGYADAADPGNPANLAAGQIEVMYTLLGDANLDGKVNGTDFNILAANFNTGGDSWDQGDFTYDGKVNGTDFNLLAASFNQGAAQSADESAVDSFAAANGLSTTSVPEPASLAGGVLACAMFARRRRR